MSEIDGHRGYRPPPITVPQPVDPSERLLANPVGKAVENHAGDICSALGIVGAATMVINHRVGKNPLVEKAAERVVLGSMVAGGVDTAIQGRNLIANDEKHRGAKESSVGSLAYAATGLIPGVSIRTIQSVRGGIAANEVAGLSLLALNGGVLGYEVIHRAPRIQKGEEDLSGYGSLAASLGGFVVAQRALLR